MPGYKCSMSSLILRLFLRVGTLLSCDSLYGLETFTVRFLSLGRLAFRRSSFLCDSNKSAGSAGISGCGLRHWEFLARYWLDRLGSFTLDSMLGMLVSDKWDAETAAALGSSVCIEFSMSPPLLMPWTSVPFLSLIEFTYALPVMSYPPFLMTFGLITDLMLYHSLLRA